jgi:hypothetical protein
VDGTLVPTRGRSIAAPSKNYRYSTNHQVVIDADTQLVVALGAPLPGNRNDCKAFGESGAEHVCRNHNVIGDGGYIATSAIIPHRRRPGEALPVWKEEHNASHRKVRASVEHTFARMKAWKILRDCRLRGEGRQGRPRTRPVPSPQMGRDLSPHRSPAPLWPPSPLSPPITPPGPTPARTPDQAPPAEPDLIPLTVPEIQCLWAAMHQPNHNAKHHWRWSWWTRRHQARAQWFHQRRNLDIWDQFHEVTQ